MSASYPTQQALPAWLADGKGIRGDAQPYSGSGISFLPAKITQIEAQVPLSNPPLPNPGGGSTSGATPHNYTVQDASSGGAAKLVVTPGNHFDSGSGATVVPTIGGTPINASTPPILTPASSDSVVYFHGTATGGSTSAIEILSGISVPASSTSGGDWYQLVAGITITTSNGNAYVASNEGGVAGSQCSQSCAGMWLFGLQ